MRGGRKLYGYRYLYSVYMNVRRCKILNILPNLNIYVFTPRPVWEGHTYSYYYIPIHRRALLDDYDGVYYILYTIITIVIIIFTEQCDRRWYVSHRTVYRSLGVHNIKRTYERRTRGQYTHTAPSSKAFPRPIHAHMWYVRTHTSRTSREAETILLLLFCVFFFFVHIIYSVSLRFN